MKSLMRWDPLRLMRGWEPLEDIRSMRQEMDRLFDRLLKGETSILEHRGTWAPSVESYVKDGKLIFKAELPGVEPNDLDVNVTDRELVIKGERKSEKESKEENYIHSEISYGSFERRFLLPEGAKVEELKAKFANGILEITVPVPETIGKARKIEIETKGSRQIEGKAAA